MGRKGRQPSLILILIIPTSILLTQDLSFKGRSALEVNIGLWGGAKASNTFGSTGIQSEAKSSGMLGSILYSYWIREQLAVTLSAGVLSGEASSTVSPTTINQHASSVVPVLLGIRYYVFSTAPDDAVRPFIAAAVGTYIGSEAENTLLAQSARSENAIGGQLGVGLDFFLGNHVKVGANVRYNLMSDFGAPIGARMNYNGGEFTLGFGYIF